MWELESGEVTVTFTCDSGALCCAYADALNLIVAGDAGGHLHFPPPRRTETQKVAARRQVHKSQLQATNSSKAAHETGSSPDGPAKLL